MIGFWKFIGAWWSDDDTTAGLPTVGASGDYVATLNTTTRVAAWAVSATPEPLVDDESGEILIDDETGNVLYDG
jgi:hypothetical protein